MLPYVYVDAVRRSGARAILLPPGGDDEEASVTVASLDGLVVSGGPDIDPVRYGAPRHPRTQAPCPSPATRCGSACPCSPSAAACRC
jgi:putative glutamine amidotransferase